MYIQVLYNDGSPTVRYTTFLPLLTAPTIWSAFSFQYFSVCSLSLTMGKIRLTISTDLFKYFRTMDKAILGLPSRAVGAKTISAFFKKTVALTVTRSGSPGPHPMHTTSILDDSIFRLFKSKYLSQEKHR